MASLITGVWGGLARLTVNLPLPADNANWITWHGPLMVCGFLGTLISLERAVGLQRWWTYAAPILTASGAAYLISGGLGRAGFVLITCGSAAFVVVSLRVIFLQRALFTICMGLGALAFFIGNILWWNGWELSRVVFWWMAFLLLTIAGERLELTRFQGPTRWSQPSFLAGLSVFLGGIILGSFSPIAGERVTGLGLIGLALWLGHFDIARRTIKQAGLTRFMAVCLLSGYVWLLGAGILLCWAPPMQTGSTYDAVLHSFFLGFVFTMIFGHAPVIFPAVLLLPVNFRTTFYLHLVLLHASLILRLAGDLALSVQGRKWGGILNGMALAVFLLSTITSVLFSPKARSGPASR